MTTTQIAAWDKLVPALNTLPAAPKRIILHWTGGGHKANDVDKAHYHFIVNGDGTIVVGNETVAENCDGTKDGVYAAHTGGFNAMSVGISFAGMGSAAATLTESQVRTGLAFVALCCKKWKLDPMNSAQLFTHMEAWTLHKVKGTVNDQKIDIGSLKFKPELKKHEVGPWLRKTTKASLDEIVRLTAGA